MVGVLHREVLHPAEKGRVAQLYRHQERLVQPEEDGYLYQHGQTAHHRVDLVLLVQGHGLLVQPVLVVFIYLAELRDARLEFLHLLHVAHADVGERVEDDLHHDGQQDDGHAPVAHEPVEKTQDRHERLGDEGEHPVVQGVLEVDLEFFEVVQRLRPHVDVEGRIDVLSPRERNDGGVFA